MDEIEFLLDGERHRLTREGVIRSVEGVAPDPVQTWAVEVDGRLFPVKQVLAVALGISRRRFITHRARDLLRRLGFRVIDVQMEQAQGDQLGRPTDGRDAADMSLDRADARLPALTAAVQYGATRPDATVPQILDAAEAFEAWLRR